MLEGNSRKLWIFSFGTFALLATAQIVFLTIQNWEMKKAISRLGTTVTVPAYPRPSPPSLLKTGDQVEAFKAIDVDGHEKTISYSNGDSLLLITATKCPWCGKTMPVWNEIAEKEKGRPIRILAVSLDGKGEIKDYIKTNSIKFEVVNFADDSTQRAYKAFATPQTILVKQGGIIAKTWRGLLTKQDEGEVLKSLSNNSGG